MSENAYDRAVATWIARKLGVSPEHVRRVRFSFEPEHAYSSMTIDSAHAGLLYERWQPAGETYGIRFAERWSEDELSLDEIGVTPGEFIEQCVKILEGRA